MKLILALFALLVSNLIQANPLNKLVMFGDSLSDNGNLYQLMKIPSSPPYYKGRFSNGPVWIENLAELYFHDKGKAHLLDYAFGGADIDEDHNEDVMSLERQVDKYLSAHQDKAAPDGLYIIWIGANNYLMTPQNVEHTLDVVNKGIRESVDTLVNAGAKHIMLVNLPDLGVTPFPSQYYSKKEAPLIREQLSRYTRGHNERLAEMVGYLKETNPEVKWLYFDASANFNKFLEEPQLYGISNIKDACYSSDTADQSIKNTMLHIASRVMERTEPGNCDDYLFFDGVHPTANAHRIIAEQAKDYLESEGVEIAR